MGTPTRASSTVAPPPSAVDPRVADKLIVALDVPTGKEAEAMARRLEASVLWFKLGLELFCSEGPAIVESFTGAGRKVFLDLKLHDIPATVGRATQRLAKLGAGLLTVHAGGGEEMMRAAVEAAGSDLKVLAVTALTSLDEDDLKSIGVNEPIADVVVRRALLAHKAGCYGVVASPHEAALLRERLPADFCIVTPGVRPSGADRGDQKRVMTPAQAIAAGADRIVVGRPIRDAADPLAAAQSILEELGQ